MARVLKVAVPLALVAIFALSAAAQSNWPW